MSALWCKLTHITGLPCHLSPRHPHTPYALAAVTPSPAPAGPLPFIFLFPADKLNDATRASPSHCTPIVELLGMTGARDKDGNLLHAQPNRPGARFAIVLTAHKSAELGNQAHHGAERGRLPGHGLFVQDERRSPLVMLEQQVSR